MSSPRARERFAPQLTPAFPLLSEHRKRAELEAWICEELAAPHLFSGLTTHAIRVDRLEVFLTRHELLGEPAGKFGGQAFTWQQVLEKFKGAASA